VRQEKGFVAHRLAPDRVKNLAAAQSADYRMQAHHVVGMTIPSSIGT
jgi:hypothetical protein